jgi:hypothetical protein
MPQFITYNGKRYEIIEGDKENIEINLSDLVYHNGTIIKIETYEQSTNYDMQIYMNLSSAKKVIEVPIFTEHTLSSVMIKIDKIKEDIKHRSTFNRIRLSKEDFKSERKLPVKDFLNRNY